MCRDDHSPNHPPWSLPTVPFGFAITRDSLMAAAYFARVSPIETPHVQIESPHVLRSSKRKLILPPLTRKTSRIRTSHNLLWGNRAQHNRTAQHNSTTEQLPTYFFSVFGHRPRPTGDRGAAGGPFPLPLGPLGTFGPAGDSGRRDLVVHPVLRAGARCQPEALCKAL